MGENKGRYTVTVKFPFLNFLLFQRSPPLNLENYFLIIVSGKFTFIICKLANFIKKHFLITKLKSKSNTGHCL